MLEKSVSLYKLYYVALDGRAAKIRSTHLQPLRISGLSQVLEFLGGPFAF